MSIFVDGGLTFHSGSVSMCSTSGPVLFLCGDVGGLGTIGVLWD